MKRIVGMIVALGLCGAAILYMSACAKQSNPVSPDLHLVGAGDTLTKAQPMITTGPSLPGSVSQTAKIYFNTSMDPASFNNTTVLIYTMDPQGFTETLYQKYTLQYVLPSRELMILPTGGAWDNNQRYHIVVTTGVRSLGGSPLDGNTNHIAEGPEFDNVHYYFFLGAPPATIPPYTQLPTYIRASGSWASNSNPGGTAFAFGNNVGQVDANYSYVTITVQFTTNGTVPADFAMDSSTFFASSNTLHSNVSFTDNNSVPVSPVYVEVTSTASGRLNDTLRMVFNLTPSTKYLLRLKGGVGGIRSTDGSNVVLARHLYFDGNGNGAAEAVDDTPVTALMTQSGTGPIPAVRVTGENFNTPLRRFELTFNVPTGIGTLDPASLNSNTLRLVEAYDGLPIPFTSVEVDNSLAPNPVVYIYVPLKFTPVLSDYPDSVKVIVSNQVRSSDGLTLDQNADGVLLTKDDNYATAWWTVISYAGSLP